MNLNSGNGLETSLELEPTRIGEPRKERTQNVKKESPDLESTWEEKI